jgi:hypothetical protein
MLSANLNLTLELMTFKKNVVMKINIHVLKTKFNDIFFIKKYDLQTDKITIEFKGNFKTNNNNDIRYINHLMKCRKLKI